MSQTYSLFCHETRQKCWAGQSSPSSPSGLRVYSGSDSARAIGRFLEATAGHPVVLLEDEKADCHDYKEFNDPGDTLER